MPKNAKKNMWLNHWRVQKRKDAIPMKAKLKTSIDLVGGFKVDHGPYSGAPDSLQAERQFIPPCTLR